MSKARLVLTALFVDRQSAAEVARRYGLHRSWVYRLKERYEAEGEPAFEPRSRRPQSSPTATPTATVELIVELRTKLTSQGHDAGPATIAWHLAQHYKLTVSPATISRKLTAAGGRGGRSALEHELRRLHVQQKNSRPGHPTTCGRLERFQQTLKKWLRAQPNQPATIDELQTLLDAFADHYNNHRPPAPHRHRTNPRHPARRRPRHPHRQRHHRRTPARTHPRPHPRLPTPETTKTMNP